MGGKGSGPRAAMLARLERYGQLRDDGMLPPEAASEAGISDRTRGGYERWYRESRKLPPRAARLPLR